MFIIVSETQTILTINNMVTPVNNFTGLDTLDMAGGE